VREDYLLAAVNWRRPQVSTALSCLRHADVRFPLQRQPLKTSRRTRLRQLGTSRTAAGLAPIPERVKRHGILDFCSTHHLARPYSISSIRYFLPAATLHKLSSQYAFSGCSHPPNAWKCLVSLLPTPQEAEREVCVP